MRKRRITKAVIFPPQDHEYYFELGRKFKGYGIGKPDPESTQSHSPGYIGLLVQKIECADADENLDYLVITFEGDVYLTLSGIPYAIVNEKVEIEEQKNG